MTVKRYEVTHCHCDAEMTAKPEGTYVTYSDYQKLVAENAALRVALDGVNGELYGKGFEVLGWHLNGDTEKLDAWFEDNDWDPETPATDAAIADIGAKAIENAINSQSGKSCITDKNGLAYINLGGIQDFAANLRAGRKG